jgi:hypothetical protein
MCCKLLEIDVLAKARGTWCAHCAPKSGCTIYDTRPDPCRSFQCGYLRLADLDEKWKPAKAKFLINFEAGANRIAIHADPERPDAWLDEPYISKIKKWALNAARQGSYVIVWAGHHARLVLTGGIQDLGSLRDDQIILPVEAHTARGFERNFIVVGPDDPRVAKIAVNPG